MCSLMYQRCLSVTAAPAQHLEPSAASPPGAGQDGLDCFLLLLWVFFFHVLLYMFILLLLPTSVPHPADIQILCQEGKLEGGTPATSAVCFVQGPGCSPSLQRRWGQCCSFREDFSVAGSSCFSHSSPNRDWQSLRATWHMGPLQSRLLLPAQSCSCPVCFPTSNQIGRTSSSQCQGLKALSKSQQQHMCPVLQHRVQTAPWRRNFTQWLRPTPECGPGGFEYYYPSTPFPIPRDGGNADFQPRVQAMVSAVGCGGGTR